MLFLYSRVAICIVIILALYGYAGVVRKIQLNDALLSWKIGSEDAAEED